tara:strand:+ start:6690 stop:7397 length:708 start_codon:yes stop_codon:yes gene_type:complete
MNMVDYNTNPYGTHRPCLINLIKNTTGNIIEFGCGDSSTILIKDIIKGTNRKLVTFESNKNWLDKYKHLEDENHKFHFIDAGNVDSSETAQKWVDYIKNSNVKDMIFDVVFIDSSPWSSRTFLVNYYKEKAKYIIVHDCGYFVGASGLHLHKQTGTTNLWGKVNKTFTHGSNRTYDMDFSNVANNYHVYYPYLKYFALYCGPATLLMSNVVTDDEFNSMNEKIFENNKYYDRNLI